MDLGLHYITGIELWILAFIIDRDWNIEVVFDYRNEIEIWILALVIELSWNYGSWPWL